MKKYSLIVVLFLTHFISFSQIIKERYYDANWKFCKPEDNPVFYSVTKKEANLWHRMDFFILQSQKSIQMDAYYKDSLEKIKQGKFKYYFANGNLEMEVGYENNLLNGNFINYHPNGRTSDSAYYKHDTLIGISKSWYPNGKLGRKCFVDSGKSENRIQIMYNQDGNISGKGPYNWDMKQNGIWNFYHYNGKKSVGVIFEMDSIISYKCFNEDGIEQINCSMKEKLPEFPGGLEALKKYLYQNIYYSPRNQFTKDIKGLVVIGFGVDIDGKISDITVIQSLHPDLDNIVIKAIKEMPIFSPAIQFNRKIFYYTKLPVQF